MSIAIHESQMFSSERVVHRRVGDTYPNQHLETVVRVHFYRWRPKRKPGQSGYPTVSSTLGLEALSSMTPNKSELDI